MFSIRDPRFSTALVLIGMSAFAISHGIEVTRFAVAEMSADKETARERLVPWIDTRGVASLARRHLLSDARNNDVDARTNLTATADLLGLRPLDANAWLILATLRFASNTSLAKGSSALAMSNLTGPNEGWLMANRAFFVLPLWQVLPPDSRRSAMSDLVGGWPQISEVQRTTIRESLRLQTSQAREEIRAALLLAGEDAAPVAETLGLSAPLSSPDNVAPEFSTYGIERSQARESITRDVRQDSGLGDERRPH